MQFNLLDPSLDQLVEGLNVRKFFDFSLRLAVISFCSGMRQIGLVVGEAFAEGRCQSGPP